jgi:hypothetical protein
MPIGERIGGDEEIEMKEAIGTHDRMKSRKLLECLKCFTASFVMS